MFSCTRIFGIDSGRKCGHGFSARWAEICDYRRVVTEPALDDLSQIVGRHRIQRCARHHVIVATNGRLPLLERAPTPGRAIAVPMEPPEDIGEVVFGQSLKNIADRARPACRVLARVFGLSPWRAPR